MCKLRIIKKSDSSVTSDEFLDVKLLRKVSSNNMPYYLTICDGIKERVYTFSFLGDSDKKTIDILFPTDSNSIGANIRLSYGMTSGRIYSAILNFKGLKPNNRAWNQLRIELLKIEFSSDDARNDFNVFFNIIRENELPGSFSKDDEIMNPTISKLSADSELSIDIKSIEDYEKKYLDK